MQEYLVVVEPAEGDCSAYVPAPPGCVATGKTREEVQRDMREAIRLHVDGLREDQVPIPKPRSFAEYMAVS